MWSFFILFFQISDFYQRRMIHSSSSVEHDRSNDSVEPESEQELEVWAPSTPDGRGLRLAPASLPWFTGRNFDVVFALMCSFW